MKRNAKPSSKQDEVTGSNQEAGYTTNQTLVPRRYSTVSTRESKYGKGDEVSNMRPYSKQENHLGSMTNPSTRFSTRSSISPTSPPTEKGFNEDKSKEKADKGKKNKKADEEENSEESDEEENNKKSDEEESSEESDEEENNEESDEEENNKKSGGSKGAAAVAGVSTAAIAGQALGTVGAAAQVLGFGSSGIAAGSAAASMMSAAATTGVGGSVVAALQSAGAVFAGSVGLSIAAPIAIGGTVYYLLSRKGKSKKSDKNDKKQDAK